MVQRKRDETPRRDRPTWQDLGIGALAGLVAGLLLTLVQALARLWGGVAPPSELIGDRIAPLLPVQQFLQLLDFFGGYNQLKQIGPQNPRQRSSVPEGATGYHRVLAKIEA